MRLRIRPGVVIGVILCGILFAAALRFGGSFSRLRPATGSRVEAAPSGQFPRLVPDAQGNAVEIASRPESIASQAMAIDHFLFAVVPHERIAAVSPFAHDPRYSFVAPVASQMDLAVTSDPEAVVRSGADLMIVSHSARADYIEMLRTAGIPSFRMQTVFEDFAGISAELHRAGHVTGEEGSARRQARRLQERIHAAKGRRPEGARSPRVLGYSSYATTYGRESLFDHILTELGAINVAAEQGVGPYGSISSEQVAAWNPDWIIAGAEPESAANLRDRLLSDVGVAVTTAGRKGQVLVVENRLLIAMSHHSAGLMEAIAGALYAEAP